MRMKKELIIKRMNASLRTRDFHYGKFGGEKRLFLFRFFGKPSIILGIVQKEHKKSFKVVVMDNLISARKDGAIPLKISKKIPNREMKGKRGLNLKRKLERLLRKKEPFEKIAKIFDVERKI